MASLNLVLATLVALSCAQLVVDKKLREAHKLENQLSNEVETAEVGKSSQSRLSKGLKVVQPIQQNQLGWQPLKIDKKIKNSSIMKQDEIDQDRFRTMPAKKDVPRVVWVWNPLKQPKLTSNHTRVGALKMRSLQRVKETKTRSFLLNRRNSDRMTADGNLKINERGENFFKGVLVLDANGKSKFLLQTNPNSKTPQHYGTLNNLTTSWKPNDLGIKSQNIFASVGEDGRGYVGVKYVQPSLVTLPPSSDEDKSKLFEVGGNFGSSTSNFKLVKGSTCR